MGDLPGAADGRLPNEDTPVPVGGGRPPAGGQDVARRIKIADQHARQTMRYEYRQFYIDGQWVDPASPKEFKVINPATEEVAGVISLGSAADVDRAVAAARRAFDDYSRTPPEERRALLERILAAYKAHYTEFVQA